MKHHRCPTTTATSFLLLFVLLLALVHHAQAAEVQSTAVSFGFAELEAGVITSAPTPTPSSSQTTPKPKKITPAPTTKAPTATATASIPTTTAPDIIPTTTPVVVTVAPSTAPPPATSTPASAVDASLAPSNSSTATPTETPTSATPASTAASSQPPQTPPSAHDCNATTVRLVTQFYDRNNMLEGSCAAVNNYYRFPFEGVPSRAQLVNMSKTSSCTVLMQALLQLVAVECDFKRVPLRSTAEAILQLARDLKKAGLLTASVSTTNADSTAVDTLLPSSEAIAQAIQSRRKELLGTVSSGSAAASATSTKVTPTLGANAASESSSTTSGAAWSITAGITNVDDGQHILMDKKLIVVGTFRDTPINATSSNADNEVASGMTPTPNSGGTVNVNATSTTSGATARSVSDVIAIVTTVVLLLST